jgi:hypothetical protein
MRVKKKETEKKEKRRKAKAKKYQILDQAVEALVELFG